MKSIILENCKLKMAKYHMKNIKRAYSNFYANRMKSSRCESTYIYMYIYQSYDKNDLSVNCVVGRHAVIN